MTRYVCIHGHFYQPPRENPWLEEIELQDSAYPYHDWNARISAECYGPNSASRILDPDRTIIDIVNNYSKISFNFGPTLLSWMERRDPAVYGAILTADRMSRERFSGHGSALAQACHHMILPLASPRDRRTEVAWGIKDFEHRFGRSPEGMWLPETAADVDTLEVLAERGIQFTILAPHQAARVRPLGAAEWTDVSGGRVDPRVPYLCRLPSGKAIHLFFYDGPIAQELAFGELLGDGGQFARRLSEAFTGAEDRNELVHIATDGETYGHHHRNGDMALAYCLYHLEAAELARITVYGEFLEENPPSEEVEIVEQSSWSCVHGVERWRSGCGCNSGMHQGWNQEWRAPLRRAVDSLRDRLGPLFEAEASSLLRTPWEAREEYIAAVLDRSEPNVEAFLARHASRDLSPEERVRALQLLELQRYSLLMQTSCGWFFDEISGLETVQVMQYAARAMQLAKEVSGVDLEPEYVGIVTEARSNVPEVGDGSRAYERFVKPAEIDVLRVGAHHAISSIFGDYAETTKIFAYTARTEIGERKSAGRLSLALGRAVIRSDITGEEGDLSYAVLHLGDHNVNGGVRLFPGPEAFGEMSQEITAAFDRGDVPEVIRVMDRRFGMNNYTLWHLFRDEQRKVLAQVSQSNLEEVESTFRNLYANNNSLMSFLGSLGIPLPKALRVIAEYAVNNELKHLLEGADLDLGRLRDRIAEVERWSLAIDAEAVGLVSAAWIDAQIELLEGGSEDLDRLTTLCAALGLLRKARVEPDLWTAQNGYFSVAKRLREAAREPEPDWLTAFRELGEHLGVRVS